MDFNNPKNIQHELKWNVYEPIDVWNRSYVERP